MILSIGIFLFLEIKNIKYRGPDSQRESVFIRVKLTGTVNAHCLQKRKASISLTGEPDIPGEKIFLQTLI